MDGTRGIAEIVDQTVRSHPGRPASLVRAAISQLIRAGYIQDARRARSGRAERTRREERYDRARGYYQGRLDLSSRESTWDPQVGLGRASVTVAGIGGTTAGWPRWRSPPPGWVACIGRSGHVQLSNLSRQVIYSEDDIGLAKADAAVARLRRLNSDICVTAERRRIGWPASPLAGARLRRAAAGGRPAAAGARVDQPCLPGRPGRGWTRATMDRWSRWASMYREPARAGTPARRLPGAAAGEGDNPDDARTGRRRRQRGRCGAGRDIRLSRRPPGDRAHHRGSAGHAGRHPGGEPGRARCPVHLQGPAPRLPGLRDRQRSPAAS